MSRLARALVRIALVAVLAVVLLVGGGFALILVHYGHDLPDYHDLATYVPPTGTRLYAGDGSFMAEYAAERRIVVPIDAIPPLVIHAFLTAEDREYYSHPGVNPFAIVRAALADIVRYRQGMRLLGASTITQQVVKHFLLNNRMSWSRKVKEAILAYRIDHYLTKNRVLELYLNEIYLGAGAYGVAEAAETYFQKPLDQLTLPEAAFLAALPKAPNNYNPARFPAAATDRRNWVIEGMEEQGYITQADAQAAIAAPLGVTIANAPAAATDGYFAEEVRRDLVARFGQKLVYGGGLVVHTSYVPVYQAMAERAFRDGLVAYDRRHGWRGPIAHLADGGAAEAMLGTIAPPPGIGSWQLAAVTAIDPGGATIALKYGGIGRIPLDAMRWARRTLGNQLLGPPVRRVSDVVVVPGDVVLVAPRGEGEAGTRRRSFGEALYGLRQIPNVSGGMAVMDPKTGRVFALVGGWSFRDSQFDRATQAWRQPGSAIKPFVYVTALEGDFTPSSVIEDAPIALPQGPGLPMWRPVNYEGTWVGPTTLRQALVHSRNLATARLASMIGMPAIGRTVDDFGVMDKMPLFYSMALGAGDTTLLRLTSAYAMLDDGGQRLLPSLIDSVQDRSGRILYQKGAAGCGDCYVSTQMQPAPLNGTPYRAAGPPGGASPDAQFAPDATVYEPTRPNQLVGPIADSQIVSMMQGVVRQGTGIKVAAVGKPLAGKTGTTSNFFDGWFVGFSPDLVAGVYVGFDEPRTLGQGEAGGIVAAPIFRDFMESALRNAPSLPFPLPAGADLVTVNSITGQPTDSASRDAIVEAFRPGTAPPSAGPAQDELAGDGDTDPGAASGEDTDTAQQTSTPQGIPASAGPGVGTGGLY